MFYFLTSKTLDIIFSFLDNETIILSDSPFIGKVKKELKDLADNIKQTDFLYFPAYSLFFFLKEDPNILDLLFLKKITYNIEDNDFTDDFINFDINEFSFLGGNNQFFKYFFNKTFFEDVFINVSFPDITDMNFLNLEENLTEKEKLRAIFYLNSLYEGIVKFKKIVFKNNRLNQLFSQKDNIFLSFPFIINNFNNILNYEIDNKILIFKKKILKNKSFINFVKENNNIFNRFYYKNYILDWIFLKNKNISTLDFRTFEIYFAQEMNNKYLTEFFI